MDSPLFAVWNNSQRDQLIHVVKEVHLPFKGYLAHIGAPRKLNWNAYLWGVLYKLITMHTGEHADKLHEDYKEKFNIVYEWIPKKGWSMVIKGTSEMKQLEFEQFCLMVRADAMLTLECDLPLIGEIPHNDDEIIYQPNTYF